MSEFVPFQKIGRLSREVIVTEKIDGTNGVIEIGDDGSFQIGSRSRWLTGTSEDNFGFARWALEHRDELITGLGVGRHYGEWWGSGIQRGYGLKAKRFSLFNVSRWGVARPVCCHVVPELWRGDFDTTEIFRVLTELETSGSIASPGFMRPEGVVIFHAQANVLFKKTFDKDDAGKGREAVSEI